MFGDEKWESERHRETTKADTWFRWALYFAIGLAFLQLVVVIVLLTLIAMHFGELFGFLWEFQHIGGWL